MLQACGRRQLSAIGFEQSDVGICLLGGITQDLGAEFIGPCLFDPEAEQVDVVGTDEITANGCIIIQSQLCAVEGRERVCVLTTIGPDFALKDQACCGNRWDVQFHCCIVLTCSDASGFKGVGNQIEIERAALQG